MRRSIHQFPNLIFVSASVLLSVIKSLVFPACNCDTQGTVEEICNKETSECLCKEGFNGSPRCDVCETGYFDFPNCSPCECSEVGSR